MVLFGLILVPFAVGAAAYLFLHETVSVKEYLILTAVSCACAWGLYEIATFAAMRDTEHWNGRIEKKNEGTQSCCHCRSECVSYDKKGSCQSYRQVCDHFQDYYWTLDLSTGDTVGVSCDTGSSPPKWWKEAKKGAPAAVEKSYTNYLKADPDSLMLPAEAEQYLDRVPGFPEIKNYYQVDKVLSDGSVNVPSSLRKGLAEMNADLGARYQVDVVLVLTSLKDPLYASAVEYKWTKGPKNAVTIVMGVEGDRVMWSRVVTLSKVEVLKVELRDKLPGMSLSGSEILGTIRSEIQTQFHRTPMAEFEYLATDVRIPWWLTFLAYFFDFAIVTGLLFYMHNRRTF